MFSASALPFSSCGRGWRARLVSPKRSEGGRESEREPGEGLLTKVRLRAQALAILDCFWNFLELQQFAGEFTQMGFYF